MTRLYRVLNLLEAHDELIDIAIADDVCKYLAPHIDAMRKEKDQLAQELIEHGCRRKN